jgi:hypothetical protein
MQNPRPIGNERGGDEFGRAESLDRLFRRGGRVLLRTRSVHGVDEMATQLIEDAWVSDEMPPELCDTKRSCL